MENDLHAEQERCLKLQDQLAIPSKDSFLKEEHEALKKQFEILKKDSEQLRKYVQELEYSRS